MPRTPRPPDTRTDEEKAADKAAAQKGMAMFHERKYDELEFLNVTPHESFHISWACVGVGFGGFDFYVKDGKLHIANECMGKGFIKATLCAMVDAAELEDKKRD
jgi:hypothetical protein